METTEKTIWINLPEDEKLTILNIASYIDAKGKAGLFDDIKALYKDEKNKREKKKIGCQNYHSDHLLSFISCPFVPNIFL